MKSSAVILGAAAQLASAHYFFDTTVRGGVADRQWTFVREFSRGAMFNPIKFSSNPAADIRDNSFIDGDDIRCNQNAFQFAGATDVLAVNAGEEVTVKLGVGARMEHPGPSFAYMSRAPGDNVQAYDGSGEWFKIWEEGVCNEAADFTTDAWCSWGQDTMTATIPPDTPSGEYLLRFEHIGIHRSHVNQPEHYTSCVHVKVENGGTGVPGPTVQFPGAYKDTDPYATFSIYGGFTEFPMPGPAVWTSGGGNGGSETAPPPAPPAGGDDETVEPIEEDDSTDTPPSPPAEEEEEEDDSTGTAPPPPADCLPEASPPPTTGPAPPSGGDCAALYGQCGGNGFTGPTCCSSGTCTVGNEWYSQCL